MPAYPKSKPLDAGLGNAPMTSTGRMMLICARRDMMQPYPESNP